jgi:hypothetical protein
MNRNASASGELPHTLTIGGPGTPDIPLQGDRRTTNCAAAKLRFVEDRAVRELRALEREDAGLALEMDALGTMLAVVEHVRERGEAIEAFFAGYAERESALRTGVAGAEEELAAQRASLAAAEQAVSATDDERDRELAGLAVARAADHVAVAVQALERARASTAAFERDAAALPRELDLLGAEAQRVAAIAQGVRRPGDGLQELDAWASHARAELFVTLSQLATRRERVIREANELATSVLGEPTFGSTVAQALRRVEAR